MVHKKTQYKQEFKRAGNGIVSQLYEHNNNYREYRRQVEHWHEGDHFLWDDHDSESESLSSVSDRNFSAGPEKIPAHIIKHRQLVKEHERRRRKEQQHQIHIDEVLPVPQHQDRQSQTPDWKRKQRAKSNYNENNNNIGKSVRDAAIMASPDDFSKTRTVRPRKPVKPLPKPRSMSAPLGRSPKKPPVEKPPPFIAYGMNGAERSTGAQKTHNVRASHHVYPAALRAQKRREMEVERQKTELDNAPYREKRKQALFNEKKLFNERMQRHTSCWDTEYRKSFAGHDGDLKCPGCQIGNHIHIHSWSGQLYNIYVRTTMATMKGVKHYVDGYKNAVNEDLKKYDALKDMDIFVLDNSMRESTVGQLRGHSIENKRAILEEVKKCGFKHTIIASFSHMTRVDDEWMKMLIDEGEDPDYLWAFSEVTEGAKKDRTPETEKVPIGLRKIKEAGVRNVFFELDLGDSTYDYERFSMKEMCRLTKKWINWCYDNLHPNAKILINIRDIEEVMGKHPWRVCKFVKSISKMPAEKRPFGLAFEEPGKSMPEECGQWARTIRKIMNDFDYKGRLLVHVHEKYGYCDATALECLMGGCDGIWASVCGEGASMGQASSCVTLLNMIRLGNKKVLKQYNCQHLRKAAIEVTKISTGKLPHDKQPVFGRRALDYVFNLNKDEFHLADFFGVDAPVRITTMSSAEMIRTRLIRLFGEDPQFNLEITGRMKEIILEDLRSSKRLEYMSKFGLAVLFDRAGGSLTEAMRDQITTGNEIGPHVKYLIGEIRKIWDELDSREEEVGDEMLQFDSFYHGFLAQYFSSYRAEDSRKVLKALDMDADGMIDWNEFLVYLIWAANEYPKTETPEELLAIAFTEGIIPASLDETIDE
ncbi:unnamed protein product [Owenia fusiformis]|uniref:EF-hand domain-containing protein n=1 Tax=Owenia fusiformis TaxID=6347 RepID=A0A8S4PC24_OWEFU|nr:unnamed protein product [Owenia fusiformis]